MRQLPQRKKGFGIQLMLGHSSMSLPLLGNKASFSGKYSARGIIPQLSLREEEQMDSSFIDSLVNDESNHLSFYKIKSKKRGLVGRSKVPDARNLRKALREQGNIMLISEIFTNFRPSLAEEQGMADAISKEYDRQATRIVRELDFFKKQWEQNIDEGLKKYFEQDRWEALCSTLRYSPVLKKQVVVASWREIDSLLTGASNHTRNYVQHLHNSKIQQRILAEVREVQKRRIRPDELASFKQRSSVLVQKLSKLQDSGSNRKQLARQTREVEQVIEHMEYGLKKQKDDEQDLIQTLAANYRVLVREGKDIQQQGVSSPLLSLLMMRHRVQSYEICPMQLLPESQSGLLRLAQKMLELEKTSAKLESLIKVLKNCLAKHHKVLACLNQFKSGVREQRIGVQNDVQAFLRLRFLLPQQQQAYEGLQVEFQKAVVQSNINSFSEEYISSVIEMFSVSKFNNSGQQDIKQLRQLADNNKEQQVDPSLQFSILRNEQRLTVRKKTSQEIIREKAICNLKKWLSDKEQKDSSIFERRQTKQPTSFVLPPIKHEFDVMLLVDFFRDSFMRNYHTLLKEIANIKGEVAQIQQKELKSLVAYFREHRESNKFFDVAKLMFGAEAAQVYLRKSPLMRSTHEHGQREEIDYGTLIRVSILHNQLFKK